MFPVVEPLKLNVKCPAIMLDSIGTLGELIGFAFVFVFNTSGVFPNPKSTAPFGMVVSKTVISSTSPPKEVKAIV